IGTPARGPGCSPAASLASTRFAASRARSEQKWRKALVFGFSASANSRALCANSTALNSREARPLRTWSMVRSATWIVRAVIAQLQIREVGDIPDFIIRDFHAVALFRACL